MRLIDDAMQLTVYLSAAFANTWELYVIDLNYVKYVNFQNEDI